MIDGNTIIFGEPDINKMKIVAEREHRRKIVGCLDLNNHSDQDILQQLVDTTEKLMDTQQQFVDTNEELISAKNQIGSMRREIYILRQENLDLRRRVVYAESQLKQINKMTKS